MDGEALLGETRIENSQRHVGDLVPTIEALLERVAIPLDRVDYIAVSIGPGAFTGLRVGLATALGLCLGSDRRIVPVPTLAALALQAGGSKPRAPVLDARKGQIYVGLYDAAGIALAPDRVVDPAGWLESLRGLGELAILGPGAGLLGEGVRENSDLELLDPEIGRPRASCLGQLASRMIKDGKDLPPSDVELRYIRLPDINSPR